MSLEIKPWTTIRTRCGRGRITYHPEWSPSQPWASYWLGSAGRHFVSTNAADHYFHYMRQTRLEPTP